MNPDASRDDNDLHAPAPHSIESGFETTLTLPRAFAGIVAGAPATQVGRYRLLRLIGEGGMACVYEAEQEQPRPIVALKVIKPGLISPAMLRRFTQESQALGRLQHSGIAQIYEAGNAETGAGLQPYFAMEFIRGTTLREYVASNKLTTRERLELMVRVCDAVQHAHERGIIHRDLKPGNILVDETAQPKILDFGVARVTGGDSQATRQTDLGQLIGTLAYMSPEQVLGDPLQLDTRSDVYALGVILYELLAAQLPYSVSSNLPDAVQTIREEEPARLSSIDRSYRGDIETMVAKALQKDKTRRYASAADLAADIRRYLHHKPIVARPPSTIYQLGKFAHRHRALVVALASIFLVLTAGIAVSTFLAIRARRAEQLANTESATAKAVNDFLQNDLLAQASTKNQARPNRKPDPDIKIRTALDRAAAAIGGKFAGQPLVEASIRHTIRSSYSDLGLYPQAQEQFERALALRRRHLGEEHPDTLLTMSFLGYAHQQQGQYPQAEALFSKVLNTEKRVRGPTDPHTLFSMTDLAAVYRWEGKYAQAEPLLRNTLRLQRRVLGDQDPDTLATMDTLGTDLMKEGRTADAESTLTQSLEIRQRVLGEEHPDTLESLTNLSSVYLDEHKYASAEALLRKSLALDRRVLGPNHIDTLTVMNNLAATLGREGKLPAARNMLSQVLQLQQRALGPEHPNTLFTMNKIARMYQKEAKLEQAEALYVRVLEARRRAIGPEHPDTVSTMYSLGELYRQQRKYSQAAALLTNVLEIRRKTLGLEHRETIEALTALGRVRLEQRQYSAADPLFREAVRILQKNAADDWERYPCESMLGATLAGERQYAAAEPLLLSGYRGMSQRPASNPIDGKAALNQAAEWLVQLYRNWNQPEKQSSGPNVRGRPTFQPLNRINASYSSLFAIPL